MTVWASYNGEYIEAHFSAETEKNDYGVKGSPVWDEITDVKIYSLSIMGVDVDPRTLPELLQAAILSLSDDIDSWNGE